MSVSAKPKRREKAAADNGQAEPKNAGRGPNPILSLTLNGEDVSQPLRGGRHAARWEAAGDGVAYGLNEGDHLFLGARTPIALPAPAGGADEARLLVVDDLVYSGEASAPLQVKLTFHTDTGEALTSARLPLEQEGRRKRLKVPPNAASLTLRIRLAGEGVLNAVSGKLTVRRDAKRQEAVAGAAAPTASPAPAAAGAAAPRMGMITAVGAGHITGWARLADGSREVHVIVDGRLIGTTAPAGLAPADAGGDGDLLAHGFRLAAPTELFDGAEHVVSLRGSVGERLGPSRAIRFPAPRAEAPKAEARPTPRPAPEKPAPAPALPAAPSRAQAAAAAAATSAAPAPKRRVAVVSWDMAHNPVGRAFLLAEMAAFNCEAELVGPIFPTYGDRIWPPIEGAKMPMEAYRADTFGRFLDGARRIAERVKCDVVHVGKARFSSLLIGALIKHANKCPMICDVDDHELSFFANRQEASLDELLEAIRADKSLLDKPYTEIFTRYAESLVRECDGVTVSNYALQERFGGVVVRHGRDERIFDPRLYDRAKVRREFGYGEKDKVVLFLGTPRPHKGVFEIADALETLKDDRLALCVIGAINDKRVANRFAKYASARITLNPDQPWERLPELVSMADAVFLLQDPASPVSEYQIPAKLTDALALGVPVYATSVPPLKDLIAAGAVRPVDDQAQLLEALKAIAGAGADARAAARARDYYLTELSYAVNAARLDIAYDRAAANAVAAPAAFDALFAGLEAATGEKLPRFARQWSAPAVWKKAKPDLVFLWKQNDSDIYGRRSDMMAKHLLKSGAVGRILHLDAPISAADLEKQAQHGPEAAAHQGNLVYLNTVRRVLRQADTPHMTRRTFVFRGGKEPERYLGVDLPPRAGYEDFLREALKEAGIGPQPILWVSPVVFDYPLVKSVVQPGCVIADIIDDQRRFSGSEPYKQRVNRAYEDILSDADFVLANCTPVQEAFARLRGDVRVIPNGAEVFDLAQPWPAPEELAALPRPIIGYVGNMRDRVDLELIAKVADANPKASIVLIGSAHGRPEVLDLARRPNVHLFGVRPYDEAVRFIRAFDVAMMPHLKTDLSDSMNPLKLYVYFALGVPIVTTDVANIGDIAPYARVADSHEAFLEGVAAAAAGKLKRVTPKQRDIVLGKVSWEARVADVYSAMGWSPKR